MPIFFAFKTHMGKVRFQAGSRCDLSNYAMKEKYEGGFMSKGKTVIYSFLVGGLLALIAQTILSFWQVVLAGTPMEFFMGGATLISMGVIGCILGGLAIYQYVEEWATFGALLPFSGFAMAVGMKAVGPWTTKCIWNCVWFVVWFNVLFMAICVAIGYVCGMMGVEPAQNLGVAKTEGGMLFFNAFWVGGLLAAIFQVLFLICKSITEDHASLHFDDGMDGWRYPCSVRCFWRSCKFCRAGFFGHDHSGWL